MDYFIIALLTLNINIGAELIDQELPAQILATQQCEPTKPPEEPMEKRTA